MSMFKERRGFASMDPAKQAALSSKGGKAAHVKGVAHQFNALEARQAGRMGGAVVSRDRKHMSEIGRRGGIARAKRAMEQREVDLSIRAEKGEFGKGAIIKDGKVIKRDVDATDAMEHFRDGLR